MVGYGKYREAVRHQGNDRRPKTYKMSAKPIQDTCCECGSRITMVNTGASRIHQKGTQYYWLCVTCLKRQPDRPKWNIHEAGRLVISESL